MDINVQIIDMDVLVGEQITENTDGSVTVFLNARHTQENRMKHFYHAIRHLKDNDFEKEDSDEVELLAHGIRMS